MVKVKAYKTMVLLGGGYPVLTYARNTTFHNEWK